MEGTLDPKDARPFDRKWWLQVRWTLDWIEQRNRNEIRRMQHELNCSLLDYAADRKALDLHWDQAQTLQHLMQKGLLPWMPISTKRMTRNQLRELKDLYIEKYGDWQKDPKARAKMEQTTAHLLEMANRGRQ